MNFLSLLSACGRPHKICLIRKQQLYLLEGYKNIVVLALKTHYFKCVKFSALDCSRVC